MRFSMSLAGHAGGEILGAFEAGSNEPDAVAIAFPPNTNSQDEISIRAALRDVGRPPMWASPRAWDADAKSRHVALARAGSELHHHDPPFPTCAYKDAAVLPFRFIKRTF